MSSSNRSFEIMSRSNLYEDGSELRRGPWTLEEDNLLIQYITCHGEGRWNSLAKCAGLKRTGKSCRLRWLNYLKPDIKRGNLSPHEQLLILELHSKWGNRWSKIAQHLPGRTDNEIKNYWRTRVQKQARQLKVDSNSKKFLEAIRMYWVPRLQEKMEQNSSQRTSSPSSSISTKKFTAAPGSVIINQAPLVNTSEMTNSNSSLEITPDKIPAGFITPPGGKDLYANKSHELDSYHVDINPGDAGMEELEYPQLEISSSSGCDVAEVDWFGEDLGSCSFWNSDDYLWQFRKPEEVFGV